MYRVAPWLEAVDAGSMDRALAILHRTVGPSKMLVSADSCELYARDESEADGRTPGCVVLAESAEDVLLTLEAARATGVPVTPRGGGTGRTGGAVPVRGGIVLSLMKMASIKEVCAKNRLAVVEPGVILDDLHHAVEAEGLFYPPDPNSLKSCAIGGNIAENAGGPRAFKYGVTSHYVLGLQACLIGGQMLRMGKRTIKGVAGYDVTSLMVGSEGTLGVVTEAILRLVSKPPQVLTLLALFARLEDAACAVQGIVTGGVVPRCMELMDSGSLDAVRTQGVDVDQATRAMLLVEVDGDEARCEQDAMYVGEACMQARACDVLVAPDGSRRDKLWAARRELSPALRKLARNKLSEDVAVPMNQFVALVQGLEKLSATVGVRVVCYGHAGDGNVHVNLLWDDDEDLPKVKKMIVKLFELTLALGGTISGEHGIGVLKAPYLSMEQSDELIELQRQIKAVFDPQGLMNPGKVFATGVLDAGSRH